jgi:hypothetical protein
MKHDHDAIVETGLLDQPLDAAAREGWPDWAREHAARCPICTRLIAVDALVASTRRALPPMTVESLRRRLEHRAPPDPAVLAEAQPAFGDARYRSVAGASALEVQRTPAGVRAFDPDALHLALFAVSASTPPHLIGVGASDVPGVAVEVDVPAPEWTRVITLATLGRLDAVLWREWLADATRGDAMRKLAVATIADRVHVGDLVLAPSAERGLLTVQPGPLADPDAAVTALLKQAAQAGRESRVTDCMLAYQQALELAHRLDDGPGKVKAGIGLAMGYFGSGYVDDAEDVLRSLVHQVTFDARWAESVSAVWFWLAMHGHDLGGAREWIAAAWRWNPGAGARLRQLELNLAMLERDYSRMLALLEAGARDPVSPGVARARTLQHAFALSRSAADVPMAEAAGHAPETLYELLWQELAVSTRSSDPPADVRLRQFLLDHADATVSAYLAPEHHVLVEATLNRGEPHRAEALLRLRFLPPSEAADPTISALIACGSPGRILVCGPRSGLRTLARSRHEVTAMIAAARHELQSGHSDGVAASALARTFFEDGIASGELAIASDGLLAGTPWPALLPRDADVAIREVLGSIVRAVSPRSSSVIASFADAQGDLPSASSEIGPDAAQHWFRRADVRLDAIRTLPVVGLLHIAVHTARTNGVPEMAFADGSLVPAEVASWTLAGSPVVVLSGCETAQRAVTHGVERSFGHAFLAAGASAVIATRWPVDDAEMKAFVRALLAEWPFDSAARAVSRVVAQLRLDGMSPRGWASPVVYQPTRAR